MEFEEKEIMKDDCLGFANKLCVEIFKLKSVKMLSFTMFIFMSALFIIETSVYLKTANLKYLTHYGPVYVIHFLMLLTYSLTFFIYKKIIQLLQDLCLWKINSAGKEMEENITKESKYINYCLCGYVIFGLFTGIQFSLPKDDDKDLMFFVGFFDKHFNINWRKILSFSYRLINIPTVPIMIMPYCQMIYALTHVRFQIKMLVHHLKTMDGTPCQKEIKKKIVFCAKRHAQLYCVFNETRRRLIVLIILVAIAGIIFFPNLLIFCYLTTPNIHKYLRFVSAFSLGVVSFIHIIHTGQLMEDNSSEIFETLLMKVKWYNWNKENKQIYLIFLSNASKEIRVNFSQEISLNYKMGASMMKGIYSFSSILYQF